MNVPGDFGRSDRMLLQASAGLLMLTPILMVASREVPPTILVIATVLLMVAAYRARSVRAVLVDLASTLCTPAGLVFGGLVLLMASSLMWSPVAERGANHALHFAGGVVLGAIAITTSLRLRPGFNAFIFALILSIAAIIVAMDMWLSGALREGLSLSDHGLRAPPNRAAGSRSRCCFLGGGRWLLLKWEKAMFLLVLLWIRGSSGRGFCPASYSDPSSPSACFLLIPAAHAGLAPNLVWHRASMICFCPSSPCRCPWIASVRQNALVPRSSRGGGAFQMGGRSRLWKA